MNPQLFKIVRPLIGILLIITIIFYYAGKEYGLEGVGFYILFPITFLFALILDKAISVINVKEMILFLLFLVFNLTAVFFININSADFSFAFFKILAAFMGAYIGITYCNRLNLENYFHTAFIISLLVIIYVEYSSGNFNLYSFSAPSASRGDFTHNANYYSYMALFANFSILRLHLSFRNYWTSLGLILIPFLGLAISFTTQSRSGLIFILLINVLFWFWVNKSNNTKLIHSIIRKVILLISVIVISFLLWGIYAESNIKTRMSTSVSEDERGHLAERGFEVFFNNPFTGVGAGNFVNYNSARTFTHNTYIEALAEHGLFMGCLIILVFVLPLFKALRLYSTNSSNPFYRLNLLFFSVFLLFNNVYVFYKASFAMMYFFVMLGIHYKLSERASHLNRKTPELKYHLKD